MLPRISLFATLLLAACGSSGASAPEDAQARSEDELLTAWVTAETERLSEAAGVLGTTPGKPGRRSDGGPG